VVAEEAVATAGAPATGRTFFLVDPLDGTKEFITRNGEFTVNVARVEDGVPVLGVVLAPALGLAYAGDPSGAQKGTLDAGMSGVRDWTAIRARRAPAAPIGAVSRSHLNAATERALTAAGVTSSTGIGSSLKFCLLAEGTADYYPRLGRTMAWDVAAGDAVLRAAGGIVVGLDGAPLRYGEEADSRAAFENPHFLAAGDPALLAGLDLSALRQIKAA
jgi:3'(2'),5'-bisphosphate nucleotidase